jgi:flagellar biosynthesis/type III secretory pathway protein FliH
MSASTTHPEAGSGETKADLKLFRWLLATHPQQTQQFEALVDTLELPEREEAMVLTTSWKEEGRVEGRAEGRAEGLAEGRQEAMNIFLRFLTHKINGISPDTLEKARLLNVSQLEELAVALLDLSTPEDLETWFASKP